MHALAPFAKSIAPLVLAVVFVGISWVATGEFDEGELRLAAAELLTAVAVYWVPNARR